VFEFYFYVRGAAFKIAFIQSRQVKNNGKGERFLGKWLYPEACARQIFNLP